MHWPRKMAGSALTLFPLKQPLRWMTATLAFLVFLATCACQGAWPQDDFDERAGFSVNCFVVAPIALSGRIVAVEQIGEARRPRKGGRPLLDPIRIMVSVEHVLRGNHAGKVAEIFCFRPSKSQNLRGDPFDPRRGELRLFLLRREAGRLRMITDDYGDVYAPRVSTGAHPQIPAAILASPPKAIAYVLLARGEGSSPEELSTDIFSYFAIGRALTNDREWLVSLLQPYTNDPHRGIQVAAESAIRELGFIPDAWQPPELCPAKLN